MLLFGDISVIDADKNHIFSPLNCALIIVLSFISLISWAFYFLMDARYTYMKSLPLFTFSEPLEARLPEPTTMIPCAFLRGYVRPTTLQIYDQFTPGVIITTKVVEYYDCQDAKGNRKMQNETVRDDSSSVEFGLVDETGTSWLVRDLHAEPFSGVLKPVRKDVQRYNVFHSQNTTGRLLCRVETTVHMLIVNTPVTIMARLFRNYDGSVNADLRAQLFMSLLPTYIVSTRSPKSIINEVFANALNLKVLSVILSVTTCLIPAFAIYSWVAN